MGESNGPLSRRPVLSAPQPVLSGGEPQPAPVTVARVISSEPVRLSGETGIEKAGNGDRLPLRSPEQRPPDRWATVIATTVRLWARRHLSPKHWIPGSLILVLIMVAGAAAVTLGLIASRHSAPTVRAGSRGAGSGAAGSGVAQENGGLRREAAAWVAAQVSRDAIVSCDPAMCPVLQEQGFPAANLFVLRPSVQDLLGSDVVVTTAALRSRLGSRLSSVYAPAVIASFRSGTQRIDIRAVAPDGAASYRAALRSDRRARRAAGAQLLRNPRLSVAKAARKQLASGRVDSRLLITLAALAAEHRLRIAAFAAPAPGASAGMPLRSVDISAAGPGAANRAAVLGSAFSFVLAQRPPYRPAHVQDVLLTHGREVLRVEFGAPSQLGLLSPRPIP
jgi:hypothetical protein